MTDRRLLASNGRTADAALKGQVDAERFVDPARREVARTSWLCRDPSGPADREVLFGDPFDVIEVQGDWTFGRAAKDGYVGWLPSDAIREATMPTHWVSVRTTWAYGSPDFKTEPLCALHMTSRLAVTSVQEGWAALEGGAFYVPVAHLKPISDRTDRIEAARAFLGTPYVWAGNSGFGLDCSGLVQVAMHAAGYACAADSDLQEMMPGQKLDADEPLVAGDLVFWKGHVALATGPDTIIHANAHHMMVIEESVGRAVDRIAATDTGGVTSRLRPALRPFAPPIGR